MNQSLPPFFAYSQSAPWSSIWHKSLPSDVIVIKSNFDATIFPAVRDKDYFRTFWWHQQFHFHKVSCPRCAATMTTPAWCQHCFFWHAKAKHSSIHYVPQQGCYNVFFRLVFHLIPEKHLGEASKLSNQEHPVSPRHPQFNSNWLN